MKAICLSIMLLIGMCGIARAEQWEATAYCGCVKCCNKSDCITASGKRAQEGITVACNWLAFGTPIYINGKRYIVQDRGAKSIFGSKTRHIKRVDIYFNSHKEALRFGRRKVDVAL